MHNLNFSPGQPRLESEEPSPDLPEPRRPEPSFWQVWLRETLQVIIPALVLALFVHLFLAQATVVYGQSMEPNLSAFQRLIIE